MYNDDQELLVYKRNRRMMIPGTDFDSDQSLEQVIYRLTGIQINPNNLVDLITVKDYIRENHPVNGKLNFVCKEMQREYYSYYLEDSRIYPYEFNELGELHKIPLEKLLEKQYNNYFPAYDELNKRLTYQKY